MTVHIRCELSSRDFKGIPSALLPRQTGTRVSISCWVGYYWTLRLGAKRFRSVVVITFALHAKGRGFEPRRNLGFIGFRMNLPFVMFELSLKACSCCKACTVSREASYSRLKQCRYRVGHHPKHCSANRFSTHSRTLDSPTVCYHAGRCTAFPNYGATLQ